MGNCCLVTGSGLPESAAWNEMIAIPRWPYWESVNQNLKTFVVCLALVLGVHPAGIWDEASPNRFFFFLFSTKHPCLSGKSPSFPVPKKTPIRPSEIPKFLCLLGLFYNRLKAILCFLFIVDHLPSTPHRPNSSTARTPRVVQFKLATVNHWLWVVETFI